jgi:divalent metal cation (Fe/Co/Zn/Cd) transporter
MNVDKLINGLKDFLFSFIFSVVGAAIAWWVAGKPDGTWRWLMTLLGVIVAYVIIGMLVKLAWSRYRRPSN